MIHVHFVVQNYIILKFTCIFKNSSDIRVLFLVHIIILQLKKLFIISLQLFTVKPVIDVTRVCYVSLI